MDLARKVQERLFPTGPYPAAGFDVGGASYPADAMGGDYYDFISMPDGRIGVAIGDVCGHGLAAALLMAETRALLRGFSQADCDAGTILSSVNRMLHQDTGGESFVTLFFACLDPARKSFTYASAGHPCGYVLDPAGNVSERLDRTGPALGIFSEAEFAVCQGPTLAPGDMVFLLTDGIEEACDHRGHLFGSHRPLDVIRECRTDHPEAMIKKLYESVRRFSDHDVQEDDMTSIVIRRAEECTTICSLDEDCARHNAEISSGYETREFARCSA
jgi:sigma-B regulation protein RsbU (phosphoserine phosphatase)